MMTKNEWREKARSSLRKLEDHHKRQLSFQMMHRLFKSSLWENSQVIGITVARGDEWPTVPIIEKAWQENKEVAVPKCVPKEKHMEFYKITDLDQLEIVYFGLREPNPAKSVYTDKNEIDLLIVPGLFFNESGYRIGFGGGYYDRYLADFQGITVSLAAEHQIETEIPVEPFDIPVQYICTEKRYLRCK
ncbi:5-formyltetrahydrofolate cyclo-ligase [Halobacillus salinarum]|uniref:5-formyltetrahydrofolate cyclo-ligase n=1 Tax=Halobacillus salinarum TaxID=2932257 RepID=A0ABY4EDJ1_9BACI|nr:5-formyltetrahydrofolate cyclo-ligase [Halobacillus salinarum]UOQ42516.1 5-formyltetrahydrofolate cyclo-ligase [Halobacillus salinarum]